MKLPRTAKVILKIVGVLIAIPLVLVLTLPLWLGTVVRPIVNRTAHRYIEAPFEIGHLWLNPYSGRLEVGDLVVGNPEGYKEPTAVAISNLVFDLAVTTACSKYVHVEEIVVDGLFLSYVNGGKHGANNLLQIQYNLAGGKEQYEANMARDAKAKAEAQKKADAITHARVEEEEARLAQMTSEERAAWEQEKADMELARQDAEVKYVIDHILIRNVRLKYGQLVIPIPTIELRNLGKESDGVNFSEFYEAIWEAILKSATSIGDGAKQLGGLLGDSFGSATKSLSGATGKASKISGKALDDAASAINSATDTLKGLFK